MTLESGFTAFSDHMAEAQALLGLIRKRAKELAEDNASGVPLPLPLEDRILRGCYFVLLYASMESGISVAVREAIETMSAHNIRLAHIEQSVYALALDSAFESAATVKADKKWLKRLDLLEAQASPEACTFNATAFDLELQMIRSELLRRIFKVFAVNGSITPAPELAGYIDSVKDKRNAVAHGRELVSAVGVSATLEELDKYGDSIRASVLHFLTALQHHVDSVGFVKPDLRASYAS